MSLLDSAGHTKHHQLIGKNNNQPLPELFLPSACFDFVFLDGWKTFDNSVFNDAFMPSIINALYLLKLYHGCHDSPTPTQSAIYWHNVHSADPIAH
jgi:hypothetical protein